ncbi:hypothetical protein Btru_010818 [Bulinus truncatus]|nr:hypothetical protein Btru_010818 [Bulinus truncatus]
MNQYLASETTSCLHKCFHIASENEELLQNSQGNDDDQKPRSSSLNNFDLADEGDHHSTTISEILKDFNEKYSTIKSSLELTEENFIELKSKYEKLSSLSKNMSSKLKSLQQKQKDQEKYVETITENQTAADIKLNSTCDDLMTELHKASDFIQSQTEMFSKKLNAFEEEHFTGPDEKSETFEDKMRKHEEAILRRIAEYATSNETGYKKLNDVIASLKEDYQSLSSKFNEIGSSLGDVPSKLDTVVKDMADIKLTIARNDSVVDTPTNEVNGLQRNIEEVNRKDCQRRNARTHRCPYSQMPVLTDARTHRCPYSQMPVLTDARTHRCPYSQMPVRMPVLTDGRTHRCPYSQMTVLTDARTHRGPYSQMPVLTDARTHRCPYSQIPVLTDARTHRCPYSQMPVLTDDRTQRSPYSQMPVLTDARTNRCPYSQMPVLTDARTPTGARTSD